MKKEKMNKFFKAQYLFMWFIYTFFLINVIISSSYSVIKGESFSSKFMDFIWISMGIAAFTLIVYLTFIFPHKYPEEFEEYYRKPLRRPEAKKAMKKIKRAIIILSLITIPITLFILYEILRYGLDSENIEILIYGLVAIIFLSLARYFIYICER